MCQNYYHDVQTQVTSRFGEVLAADGEVVATYAPMKRGLKENEYFFRFETQTRSNLCPDEKGTESAVPSPGRRNLVR